jgi:hypothetical protein
MAAVMGDSDADEDDEEQTPQKQGLDVARFRSNHADNLSTKMLLSDLNIGPRQANELAQETAAREEAYIARRRKDLRHVMHDSDDY